MIGIVLKEFSKVIKDAEFILGVDHTGVYAFIESTNVEKAISEFENLKRDLCLKDEQALLCFVQEEENSSFANYVTKENLQGWIIKQLHSRPAVLSEETQQLIVLNYRLTKEQNQVLCSLNGKGVSRLVGLKLLQKQPDTIGEVEEAGVSTQFSKDVFQILCNSRIKNEEITPGGVFTNLSFTKELIRGDAIRSVLLLLASILFAIFSQTYLVSCVFSFYAALFSIDVYKMSKRRLLLVYCVLTCVAFGVFLMYSLMSLKELFVV